MYRVFVHPTEQYDAFVKFTHDQLMRRFGEQPASCKYIYFTEFMFVVFKSEVSSRTIH